MNGVMSKDLPQRIMDEAAIEVFKGIMRKIQADNQDDHSKCWEWPQKWPADWGEKPKGYFISRNGTGRGQFVLSKVTNELQEVTIRQISPEAHTLSYQHFNLKLDPSLTMPEFEGSDWLGKYYLKETETVTTPEGNVKVMRRVVRHDPILCKSEACVNPFHLDIGTDWQNTQLDEAIKNGVVELSHAALALTDRVTKDIKAGELDARVLKDRYDLPVNDIVNIAKAAGLSLQSFLHDFNPHGRVDHKPKATQ